MCYSDQEKLYRLGQGFEVGVEVRHYSVYKSSPMASDYIRCRQQFKIKTRHSDEDKHDGDTHSLLRMWWAKNSMCMRM